jgi:uncharacterized protein (DUF2236 family)
VPSSAPTNPLTRLEALARRRIHEIIRSSLTGDSHVPEQYEEPKGDFGLYGPGSAVWMMHDDISALVGGIASLYLQTLHPLAMAGVAQHSDYETDPLGRLQRTAAFVRITTFGSRRDADRIVAAVRKIHQGVVGTAPDGRLYAATDPDLAVWVHATEFMGYLKGARVYHRKKITPALADRYLAEGALVAEMLGARNVPRSVAEMRAYFRRVRPELVFAEQARQAFRWLMDPPVGDALQRAGYAVMRRGALELLPRWGREMLEVPHPSVLEVAATRAAVHGLLEVMRFGTGAEPTFKERALARALARPEPETQVLQRGPEIHA